MSHHFIRRPVMTTLVMLTILFFGLIAYRTLPVSDLPNVEYPIIQVSVDYPGATPQTMANRCASPLEREFATIQGVNSIASNSSIGSTTIVLQFALNKPINVAAQDVEAAINRASAYLPDDLPSSPTYTKVNPTQTPIMWLAVSSDAVPVSKLYDYAHSVIGKRLSMISGVSEVITYGSPFAVRVQVNPDLLSSRQIGLEDIANTVSQGNPEMPTGSLYGPDLFYNINALGQIDQAAGYNRLIVRNNRGALVSIDSLGKAINSQNVDKYNLVYYNGTEEIPSIMIGVQRQGGANAVHVIKQIKSLMPELIKEIPKTVQIYTIFDQSTWIFESIEDVEFTLLIAFFLVILVILFYFGKFIDTFIPIVVLPITIVGTFGVLYMFGYSLNILTLLAITLSIGFLIDDAIVMLENIVRHIELGENRFEAAIKGAREIGFTIVATSVCLCIVFIPMIFMSGVLGRIFSEFAMTIIIAIVISTFVSLTLTPLLCSRFITAHHIKNKTWLERFSEKMNVILETIYEKALHVAIRHRFITLCIGIVCFALTLYGFVKVPKNFLPDDDLGFVQGMTFGRDGASPFKTIENQEQINQILKEYPYTEAYGSVGGKPSTNKGLFFLRLKPYKDRVPLPQVIAELNERLRDVVGVKVFLKPIPLIDLDIGTSAATGSFQYTLQSLDLDELYSAAEQFIAKLENTPGFSQVFSDMHNKQPQLDVEILRDRAHTLNVAAQDIETALKFAYSGGLVTRINGVNNQYNVIVEVEPEAYRNPAMLDRIYVSANKASPAPTDSSQVISTVNNLVIPLSNLVKVNDTIGPESINHLNILPSVTISFNVDGIALSEALNKLDLLAKESLPPNVSGSVQGTADVFRSTFSSLGLLSIIAVFMIYVILGILYENFIHPITIMSSLPPTALGGIVTLIIFGQSFSLYAFVGIMMLLGIVMKNGIMMVDFATIGRTEKELSITDSIIWASTTRFRPIMMTTFSTIMGALPIAVGIGGLTALSRRPLGLAIVGGLLLSQMLTLFLTPVIYIYMETMREKLSNFFSGDKHQKPIGGEKK